MANKERLTDIILASLLALMISEAFNVFGVTDTVNTTLENVKTKVTSNRA